MNKILHIYSSTFDISSDEIFNGILSDSTKPKDYFT